MALLISSFPAPPSHIPTTPLATTPLSLNASSPLPSPNPPLSLPPSSPLPPVPGPSPVTEHETLLFITAARSRRASKLSLASSAGSLSPPPHPSVLPSKSAPQLRTHRSTKQRPPTAVLNKDLPPLPCSAPVTSSYSPHHSPANSLSTPASSRSQPQLRPGAESPDISTIIASTPRPRRKSSSQCSSNSKSRSRPSSVRRSRGVKRVSDDVAVPVPVPQFRSSIKSSYSRRQRSVDEDEESDYGEVVDGTGTVMDVRMLDREMEARLERALDGVGSEDEFLGSEDEGGGSDSSIDVQTPLPNLMLRDGMLSPHSKILPQSNRVPMPYDRHFSVASAATSVMTKSGLYKDQRDTVNRRVRHRDGTLLRGGIGLTTGLGWSDSEDEGAQSALTKRISSLVLSNRTSSSSLRSSANKTKRSVSTPQSLTRSVSETLAGASDSLARQQVREHKLSHPPPTSWGRASTASSASTVSSRSRTSTVSSVLSASSSRGRGACSELTTSLDHIRENEFDEDMATPSSASTASLPMPLTPVGDDDVGPSFAHGREKTTTPRRIPSSKNLKGLATPSSVSSLPFPRERTQSSASSASVGHAKSVVTSAPSRSPVPRPLRLPQASGLQPKMSQGNLRPPSASARLVASNSSISAPRTEKAPYSAPPPPIPSPRSNAAHVSRPVTPGDRKPRTGTGMVYKSSATVSSARPTMMRAPSSTNMRAAAAVARV